MHFIYKCRYIIFLIFIAPAFLDSPEEYLITFILLGLAVLLAKGYEVIANRKK